MNYRAVSLTYDLAPLPPTPLVSSTGDAQGNLERLLADRRGGGDGGGAKSYDGEIAWSSKNHSILCGGEGMAYKSCSQRYRHNLPSPPKINKTSSVALIKAFSWFKSTY
jgi:hypothetical protein